MVILILLYVEEFPGIGKLIILINSNHNFKKIQLIKGVQNYKYYMPGNPTHKEQSY